MSLRRSLSWRKPPRFLLLILLFGVQPIYLGNFSHRRAPSESVCGMGANCPPKVQVFLLLMADRYSLLFSIIREHLGVCSNRPLSSRLEKLSFEKTLISKAIFFLRFR